MKAYSIWFLMLVWLLASCSSSITTPGKTSPPVEITNPVPSTPTEASLPAETNPPSTVNTLPVETPTSPLTPTVTTNLPSTFAFPDPSQYSWVRVADGLQRPVGLADPGDGSGRLFIIEQPGVIRILKDGNLLPQPFLDIRDRVGSSGNEQGLLGLAFHPGFAQNGYFYVNYTNRNGDTRISRFSVDAQNPDQANADSEKRILAVDQPFPNHNGGEVLFGPDGFLYIGLGDGGGAGDPHGNGQSVNTLLGKILRLDVDQGDPYQPPVDNPFAAGGSRPGEGLPEIWAYGLRNPWRFSFDQTTADLYIADVGQNTWEEIDYLPAGSPAGANFGWNYREGSHPFKSAPPAGMELIDPVVEYDHSQGCSVTGGYVYRGQQLPEWRGVYLYGDYCSGRVWGLFQDASRLWQNRLLYETGFNISSFGQDAQGELYLIDINGGVYRLSRGS